VSLFPERENHEGRGINFSPNKGFGFQETKFRIVLKPQRAFTKGEGDV
jgi:hypothetical protein